MRKSAWVALSLLLVVALLAPGCRRKPKAPPSDYGADTEIEIDDGIDAARDPLGTRIDVELAPVYFAFDSFLIAPDEMVKVQAAAMYLRDNPGVRCVVEGHCDERGTHEYNLALGQSRADAVRAAIVDSGITGDRVETKSFGEEKLFSPGQDDAAHSLNRRSEFGMYQ